MILASLVAIVLTLILVVGIHEAGHAIAARFFGVKIQKISIGFGKSLLKWQDKHQREWIWALWPLGGFVLLLNSRIYSVAEADLSSCFDKKPIWQRWIILLAGSLANFIVAILVFTLVFMIGYKHYTPLIQQVIPQSIAAKAGLKPYDRLIAVGGVATASWQEVGMRLIINWKKKKVSLAVADPSGQVRETSIDLSFAQSKKSLLNAVGIKPASAQISIQPISGRSITSSLSSAVFKSFFLIYFFLIMLKQLFMGIIPFTLLLGPLGLFAESVNSFFQGLSIFLNFIGTFSLAVGLINLFPIPGLDGGSLVYALVEKWRGQPVSVAFEMLLHRLALIFFSLLLVQLLLNDLKRYLQ